MIVDILLGKNFDIEPISFKEKKVEWYSTILFLSVNLIIIDNEITINNIKIFLVCLILQNKIRNIHKINKNKSV